MTSTAPRRRTAPAPRVPDAYTVHVSVKPPLVRRCRGGRCFVAEPLALSLSAAELALLKSDPHLWVQETST